MVLTARGRVFVAPAKPGRFVDVSEHQPGRFREARLMPDGKSVIVLSTESGEVELWLYPANGKGPGQQLTQRCRRPAVGSDPFTRREMDRPSG